MSTNPFGGDERLVFDDDPVGNPPPSPRPAWRILVADDDPVVHQSTRLALSGVEIFGRPLELLQAKSAGEVKSILRVDRTVDLILLDIVMETEDAGLGLIRVLRQELGYPQLRIIIRTGQAGHAREEEIRTREDIDGFLHKSQQTRSWLVAMLSEVLGTARGSKGDATR